MKRDRKACLMDVLIHDADGIPHTNEQVHATFLTSAEARHRRLQGHELFASVCKTTKRWNRAIIAFPLFNRVVDYVKVRMHRFDRFVLATSHPES